MASIAPFASHVFFYQYVINKLPLPTLIKAAAYTALTFLLVATYSKALNAQVEPDPILSLSAVKQAEMIRNGQLSAEKLVQTYLDRITAIDRQGPRIQSILALNPNALNEAKQKDKERAQGKVMGLLHGVPVLVKDNIETIELPTTAGAIALANNFTKRDAPIIARLRAQGAIILGKTNLSQWANFRSNESVSGWSALGGQTRNPHSLDRTPCGSSSGSGAAIAAQLASLAIGTETNGSIICPSAMNGIVGFKPTVGLLSRRHIVPISVTQDTAGPMTRYIEDAALMLTIMAGSDPLDKATLQADKQKTDYLATLKNSIKGKRIGVFKAVQGKHQTIIDEFSKSTKILEKLGAELVVIDEYKTPDNFWKHSLNLLYIEFKQELNHYLAQSAEQVQTRSLEDVINFNATNNREFAIFDQDLFEASQAKEGYDEDYQKIKLFLEKATRQDGIDKLLKEYKVDAIVMPSTNPAFIIDVVYGDGSFGGSTGAGWMAAIAGYPHVTVPMASMKGLPINLSFMGGAYSDALLLNIAYQYEQATQAIITPTFATSAFEHPYFKARLRPIEADK